MCAMLLLLLYIFGGLFLLCEASAIKWALELGRVVVWADVSIVCTLLYQREIIKVQSCLTC